MEKTILYFALVAVSFTFLFLRRVLHSDAHLNLPPRGPYLLPIIGHLHLLSLPIHHALSRISATYGPVLLLRFGSRSVLLVSSPSAAEECLTKNDIIFANRPQLPSGKHFSYNYTILGAAPYGPLWRDLRHFATLEIFSSTRTAALSSLREGEVRSLISQLFHTSSEAFQQVELKSKFSELTVNMIMLMIAGKRYYGEHATVIPKEAHKFQEIIREFFYLNKASSPEDFLPMMRWLGVNRCKNRLVKLEKEIDELLQEMIDERLSSRQKKDKEVEKKTILDVMLSLQETEAEYYTNRFIKGMMLVFIDNISITKFSLSHLETEIVIFSQKPTEERGEINKVKLLHVLTFFPFSSVGSHCQRSSVPPFLLPLSFLHLTQAPAVTS